MRDISQFLDAVRQWAAAQPDIDAVALVGSFARGAARADSDVDLVIITRTPRCYLEDASWLNQFGEVTRLEDEDWGLLQSRRTFYVGGGRAGRCRHATGDRRRRADRERSSRDARTTPTHGKSPGLTRRYSTGT